VITYGVFEAIDNRGNFGFSSNFYLEIQGQPKVFPLTAFVGTIFFILFIVPTGIIVFKEYDKKGARTTLRNIKKTRNVRRRKKRGTRRMT
jgi:hypothetical protein